MSKGGKRPLIDLSAVMDNIPTIMGLNLKRKGENKWEGGYYMNRERHPYRRDKLKVTIWNYSIWVHEEGNRSMSLATWLVQFGGAVDYREAYRIMRGNAIPIFQEFHSVGKEGLYVDESIYEEYRKWGLESCNLYNWMCRLFGEAKVREAWERYNVTTNERGDVVFWFRDNEGLLCHDKIVRYRHDGHRDKGFGGSRRFKTSDGYTQRCMFGSHLIESDDEVVNIVESEKTAMIMWIVRGGVWLATGGKTQLRDSDARACLYPDMDAICEWRDKGNVIEWWEGEEGLGDHDDIGDLMVRKIKNGSLKVK